MSDTRDRPETRIVQDRFEDCIYRPGQVARCPARVPTVPLSPEQLDLLLEEGDQRVGGTVFRTECPFCSACEPVRIDIPAFTPSRAQRRVMRRNEDLTVELGPPTLSRRRVSLWNRHRRARGLLTEHSRKDPIGYQEWLVESCAPTTEVRYSLDGRLVAVSLLDLGLTSANSAYHFFDPSHAARSLGVYSVLHEIEVCRARGMRWYYLGLWVEDCAALRYKSGYHPHERFVRGRWVPAPRPIEPTEPTQPPEP
ncbi:MAG: arginyltransferase [Myxococcota bacterium]